MKVRIVSYINLDKLNEASNGMGDTTYDVNQTTDKLQINQEENVYCWTISLTSSGTKGRRVLKTTTPNTAPNKCAGINTSTFDGLTWPIKLSANRTVKIGKLVLKSGT
jgi:hypothetical protein